MWACPPSSSPIIACKQEGIQPLPGLEIDLDSGPLHLLAMNVIGWSNLCRLSSALAMQDDPEKPCLLDWLYHHADGLIALSNEPEVLVDIFPVICMWRCKLQTKRTSCARKLIPPTVVIR